MILALKYVEWLRAGVIQPAERPRIIGMHGAVATVSGDWTFGQITTAFAAGEATRLAYEHGIGAVGPSGAVTWAASAHTPNRRHGEAARSSADRRNWRSSASRSMRGRHARLWPRPVLFRVSR
jgi:hypothetical protein